MGGYRYRPTVGCGSPHDAVGIGTHNHRPTGDAGAAPTRGPHSTSYGKHTEHMTESAVRHTSRRSGGASMHVERRTRLQPVVKGPPGLPYICTCCGIHVTGTSFPLFFASEVHFDPWGFTPAMRRLSLAGARSACERERPCHSVGHPDAAGLILFFQTSLQLWCHVCIPKPADKAPSSHWQNAKRQRAGGPPAKHGTLGVKQNIIKANRPWRAPAIRWV